MRRSLKSNATVPSRTSGSERNQNYRFRRLLLLLLRITPAGKPGCPTGHCSCTRTLIDPSKNRSNATCLDYHQEIAEVCLNHHHGKLETTFNWHFASEDWSASKALHLHAATVFRFWHRNISDRSHCGLFKTLRLRIAHDSNVDVPFLSILVDFLSRALLVTATR